MKKEQRKMLTIALVLIATISSCSKNEDLKSFNPDESKNLTQFSSESNVDIADLKMFMSKLINVDSNKINYDKENESFSIQGINQISKAQLTKIYSEAKK